MSTDDAAFVGEIPATYERHLVPMLFEEYAADLVSRLCVEPGGAVLETACGTGVVTRRLRSVLDPSVRLEATDLSEPMLEVARRSLAETDGTTFVTADATSLPHDNDSFDAVVCQFGAMFFPDRILGYREAARVIRPGGRFVFNVWDDLDHNPIPATVHDALCELLPDDPPPFFECPFGYTDMRLMARELEAAGFGRVEITVLPAACRGLRPGPTAEAFFKSSPLGAQLAERGAVESGLRAATDALTKRFGDGPIEAPMQAIVVVADPA